MIVFALLMAVIVAAAVRWAKPRSDKEAFGLSVTWALISLAATGVVAFGNQTVDVFFGQWFDWLVFVAMAAAPLLLMLLPSKAEPPGSAASAR
jgi:O-antigen/teichoic acid export membrane protein